MSEKFCVNQNFENKIYYIILQIVSDRYYTISAQVRESVDSLILMGGDSVSSFLVLANTGSVIVKILEYIFLHTDRS